MVTVEQLGAESFVYLDVGQPEPLVVKARWRDRCQARPDRAGGVPAGALYLFDEQGRCYPRETYH